MLTPIGPHTVDASAVDHFVVTPCDWKTFVALVEARGDHGPRLTYLDGYLELMSPSATHELLKKNLARLFETWALDHEVDLNGYGSETFKRERRKSGIEPDECYFLGPRGARSTPDLVIEVIWTSGRLDRLEAYRRLGVGEVWWWEDGALSVWVLKGERYARARKSRLLPTLDLATLAKCASSQSQTAAVKAFRASYARH
jgi:Uma2 family endonuclease